MKLAQAHLVSDQVSMYFLGHSPIDRHEDVAFGIEIRKKTVVPSQSNICRAMDAMSLIQNLAWICNVLILGLGLDATFYNKCTLLL